MAGDLGSALHWGPGLMGAEEAGTSQKGGDGTKMVAKMSDGDTPGHEDQLPGVAWDSSCFKALTQRNS